MTKLDVLDTPTMQELVSIIERFQFSLAMFTKFSELFAKARFHGASEDSVASDELGQLRDLGWLSPTRGSQQPPAQRGRGGLDRQVEHIGPQQRGHDRPTSPDRTT